MKNRDIEPGLWEVSLLGGFSSAICVDGIRYDDDEIQFRHRGQCVLRADQAELIGYRRVDSAQLLVKFIPRKDWADSHRHGVHMQPASKYFEIEKDDPGGIYDKYDMGVAVGHEAITFSLWPQGHDDRKVEINTRHGLREPATIRYKDADRLYMTCFSCVSVSCSDLKVNGDFDPPFFESIRTPCSGHKKTANLSESNIWCRSGRKVLDEGGKSGLLRAAEYTRYSRFSAYDI